MGLVRSAHRLSQVNRRDVNVIHDGVEQEQQTTASQRMRQTERKTKA